MGKRWAIRDSCFRWMACGLRCSGCGTMHSPWIAWKGDRYAALGREPMRLAAMQQTLVDGSRMGGATM